MDIWSVLKSEQPGNALEKWQGKYPSFLMDAWRISAGPWPWHSGSLMKHMKRCMNAVAGDPLAVWLAMTHDSGKLTTPQILLPHHYGHEKRGEILAQIWAEQLELPPEYAGAGCLAARWHMRAGRYRIIRPGKKRMLLTTFPPFSSGKSFWKMVDADTKSDISRDAETDWLKLKEQELKNPASINQ